MPHLVVVPPGPVHISCNEIHSTTKFLDGMEAYAERFPGRVTMLATPAAAADSENLGGAVRAVEGLGFDCVLANDLAATLTRLNADITTMSLSEKDASLIGVSRATVLQVEHTGMSRLAMALTTEPRSALARGRLELGYRRLHRRLLALASTADGVQCNGAVAWEGYRAVARNAIRVYDSRVRTAQVEAAREVHTPWPGGRLSLGFSGRLLPIKGPEYAVRLLARLRAAGVDATLDVFGDGPMMAELRDEADPGVSFRGVLDFDRQWCETVATEIDVMVLPHVQGDPSGTYLESAGMGVPVVGFDNPALRDLTSDSGLGWVAPIGDLDALTQLVLDLASDPARVERASRAALTFMGQHSFERDFDLRVAHLLEVLQ